MAGVSLRHRTKRSGMALVPTRIVMGNPRRCPTCGIPHKFKTVHLWLDSDGLVTVSQGVLQHLKTVGMPDLDFVAEVAKPPPLVLSQNMSRASVDQDNRKITEWGKPQVVRIKEMHV